MAFERSTLGEVRNCLRRSKLELLGPRNGLKLTPQAPEGCVLRLCSRRCRIWQQKGPPGALE
eukprot:423837-Alexandrium_andersonii.AAC.1